MIQITDETIGRVCGVFYRDRGNEKLKDIKNYFKEPEYFGRFVGIEMMKLGLNESYSNIEDLKVPVINKCHEILQIYKEDDAKKTLLRGSILEETKNKILRRRALIRDKHDFNQKVEAVEYTYVNGVETEFFVCPTCHELSKTRANANKHFGGCIGGQLENRLTITVRRDKRFKLQAKCTNKFVEVSDDDESDSESDEEEDSDESEDEEEYVINENAVSTTNASITVYAEEESDESNVKRRRLM